MAHILNWFLNPSSSSCMRKRFSNGAICNAVNNSGEHSLPASFQLPCSRFVLRNSKHAKWKCNWPHICVNKCSVKVCCLETIFDFISFRFWSKLEHKCSLHKYITKINVYKTGKHNFLSEICKVCKIYHEEFQLHYCSNCRVGKYSLVYKDVTHVQYTYLNTAWVASGMLFFISPPCSLRHNPAYLSDTDI